MSILRQSPGPKDQAESELRACVEPDVGVRRWVCKPPAHSDFTAPVLVFTLIRLNIFKYLINTFNRNTQISFGVLL